MPILQRLSDLRYSRAVERYTRGLSRLNAARSGAAPTTAAVVARAAQEAEADVQAGTAVASPPPPVERSVALEALGAVAEGVQTMIAAEMALSAPFSKIPFPTFPALRVWDLDVGLPHAHNHPPNVVPPSPVPIPLPSMGPVIPIPILSGASTVLINGQPAARCGDLGLAIFCGGYFPMFEVFFGSANVWIEGARAARVAIDMTKHCTFSAPRPSDPPLGPMIGTTLPPGSPNVQIGGVPMPSLFSLAVAQALKAVFKGAGAVLRRATARSYVDRLLRRGALVLDSAGAPPGWTNAMLADLHRIAATRTGRQVLRRIERSGRSVRMIPYHGYFPTPHGPVWSPHNAWAAPTNTGGLMDMATGRAGPGCDAVVAHNPAHWANHPSGGVPGAPQRTTSDGILLHEMNHAANATEGRMRGQGVTNAHDWDQRWNNFEEYDTVAKENGYRQERGLPTRRDYTSPFP